ncbi:MAG: hypothetical protein QOC63_2702 [Mycobacterium sp.]|nr:hypothetical protein [Mycobacterium sp.]
MPHNWEAGLWFDETTSTLLAGDLLTHAGQCPALTESDCVAPALEAESIFHATGLTTDLGPTLEQLAELNPSTLAIMHGSSYSGGGAAQLRAWPTATPPWRAPTDGAVAITLLPCNEASGPAC